MLKNKILLKITGSIAAYKSAYLTSKLVQNGYDVKVVMSEAAEKFVGTTTFEALTGYPVYTDMFARREALSHINLMKWADLIIVAPATANTINHLANGDGSSLITTLFLAHNFEKPYLIAPAMNSKMYLHPATKHSLETLKKWDVTVLQLDSGYLACGDEGIGKLLDPDKIFDEIEKRLKPKKKNISVLITSGGTRENIDDVRFIANMSTGNTGATIADFLIEENFDVTFLHANNSVLPKGNCETADYISFEELNDAIKLQLSQNNFDVVVHLAAVSDYSVSEIKTENKTYTLPLTKKMNSSAEKVELHLKKNFKIIDRIKKYSKNKNLILIGFKLVRGNDKIEKENAVKNLFNSSKADFVILNDFEDRNNSVQSNFTVFNKKAELEKVDSAKELSKVISKQINKENREI
jgi:phosphopantothenoylcysteine decarboxylase/phosphopantothenate--cysteine ligase